MTGDRKSSGSTSGGDERRQSSENTTTTDTNNITMKSEPGLPSTPNSTSALLNQASTHFHPALMNPQLQAMMQQQSLLQQQLLQQQTLVCHTVNVLYPSYQTAVYGVVCSVDPTHRPILHQHVLYDAQYALLHEISAAACRPI